MPAPADILGLALAFYRAPIQYQELLRTQAELPGDTAKLLRIANQDGLAMNAGCRATGAPAAELREAALFFIEQVCFVRGASHYQVLGLTPQASTEQIKDHYRLLMRLFHPDQIDTQERWIDVYAQRVNQAYNILRNPGSRRTYDASLKANQQKPLLAKDDPFKSPPSVTRPGLGLHLPPLVWRYLPQWVLGGTAVIALLLVTGAYLSNQRVSPRIVNASAEQVSPSLPPPAEQASLQAVTAIWQGETGFTELNKAFSSQPLTQAMSELTSDQATQDQPENPVEITVQLEPVPAKAPRPEDTLAEQVSPAKPLAPPPTAKAPHPKAAPAEQAPPAKPSPPPKVAKAPRPQVAATEQVPSGKPSPPPTPIKVEKRPVIDQMVTRREEPVNKDPTGISEWELTMLIGQFISAYERGDLKQFIGLFNDHARTNESSNKVGIGKDYKRLFHTTQTRRMVIENFRWRQAGASRQGDGRFQVQVWKRSGLPPKRFTGTLHLLVEKRDGEVLIKNFYYVLDKAS